MVNVVIMWSPQMEYFNFFGCADFSECGFTVHILYQPQMCGGQDEACQEYICQEIGQMAMYVHLQYVGNRHTCYVHLR